MKITDNVYAVEASKGSYVYALRLSDGITLIDTSFPGRGGSIADELAANRLDQVKRILLTHHDVDHIGNAAFLQQKYQCDVYISKTDLPYVQGKKKREGVKRIISSLIRVKTPEIQPLPVNIIMNIRIIPTPGHTPGHTCFLFDGVLFAGDLVNSKRGVLQKPPAPMTWNMRQAIDSAKAMNNMKFNWVCPAHGQPVKTGRIDI